MTRYSYGPQGQVVLDRGLGDFMVRPAGAQGMGSRPQPRQAPARQALGAVRGRPVVGPPRLFSPARALGVSFFNPSMLSVEQTEAAPCTCAGRPIIQGGECCAGTQDAPVDCCQIPFPTGVALKLKVKCTASGVTGDTIGMAPTRTATFTVDQSDMPNGAKQFCKDKKYDTGTIVGSQGSAASNLSMCSRAIVGDCGTITAPDGRQYCVCVKDGVGTVHPECCGLAATTAGP